MTRQLRPLTNLEARLVSFLLGCHPERLEPNPGVLVREMDAGMGSLQFASGKAEPRFGDVIGECQFDDEDGIPVIARLIVDEEGDLFELDVWKTDFSPLIRIPEPDQMKRLTDGNG